MRNNERCGGRWWGPCSGRCGCSIIVIEVQRLRGSVEEKLARVVELFKHVLDEEITPGICAACSLVTTISKREVPGSGVVCADVEHPIRPPQRMPHKYRRLRCFSIRHLRHHRVLRAFERHATRGVERESSATTRV